MKQMLLLIVMIAVLLSPASSSYAAIPPCYTNDNYYTSEHDEPLSFTQDTRGNFSGITVTGKFFYQTNVTNAYNIRLQRFSVDEAFFYISDRGVIIAPSDTVALSIYLMTVT